MELQQFVSHYLNAISGTSVNRHSRLQATVDCCKFIGLVHQRLGIRLLNLPADGPTLSPTKLALDFRHSRLDAGRTFGDPTYPQQIRCQLQAIARHFESLEWPETLHQQQRISEVSNAGR